MLGKLFNQDDDKADTKQEEIQATIQNLTNQIGTLRQELQGKNTQIEQLQEQLKSAQAGAQSSASTASQQTQQLQQQNQQLQQQITDLKRQLEQAKTGTQGDLQAAKQLAAEKDKQIADLQAKLAATASAAGVTAPAGAQAAALAVGGQAWVTREGGMGLRLRSGAGLEHNVLGSLPPGSELTLLGGPQQADNYSWWHIRTADGREGWVAGQDLRTQPD